MPKLNFLPAKDGFHFNNNFTNKIIGGINAGAGLCGGMSLAAYNYFISKLPVPTHSLNAADNDFGGSMTVPPDGSRLRNYILAMQWQTFPFCGPYLVFPGFNTPSQHFTWCVSEFSVVKKIIDKGNFCIIGLRGSFRLSGTDADHQVLVYGYDENPSILYVYDSNEPDNEVELMLDTSRMELLHKNKRNVYLSFFNMMELDPRIPVGLNAPDYIDLGIKVGLTVTTNGIAGSPASFSVIVKNYGDFNAHVNFFLIWLRDPSGTNIDYMTGGMQAHPLQIAPSEEVIISGQCPHLGTMPGNYTSGACYLSKQNQWIGIPAKEAGTITQVVFNLRSAVVNSLNVTSSVNYTSANQIQVTFIINDTSGKIITSQIFSSGGTMLGSSSTPIIVNSSCRITTTTKKSTEYKIEKDARGKPHKVYELLTCTNRICTPAFADFIIKASGFADKTIRVNYNFSSCV
jgi:hypothetical protein